MGISSTLALVGGKWSASRPSRSTSGERAPGTHWIGGWVGRRTSLDDVEMTKFLTLSGLKICPPPPTVVVVQPVTSCYTN
jgi:hypothetical protein